MSGKRAAKKAAVIVLNWNGLGDTVECVRTLKKLTYPDYKIIMVDNGSTDGSADALQRVFPEIEIIRNEKNLGFAGGENTGMRRALAEGAEYIAIINNDATADPDFLTELVSAAESEKGAGMLASKVYFYDRPQILWYAGASFHPWIGWGRHRGFNMPDRGQFDDIEETQRPCGCSMLVTKELCEKIGLLDERFFCYSEDIDWGMRAGKAGFKVLYVPRSKVWHKVSRATGGPSSAVALYYTVRNTLMCVDKNKPLPLPLRSLRYAAIIGVSFLSLFTMRVPKALGSRRIVQGARDYFLGRCGERRL